MNFRTIRAALLAGASAALASHAASAANVETVVVTGSYVSGAADQAALPVTTLSADDLKKRGSPSMVELIKALPGSGAVFGDANQFTAGYTEGVSNVNLRGLGSARTLVLLNSRRLPLSADSPLAPLVDLNLLPTAAIGRIEVLKDGAAATYGSEAIAGVVNIITRKDFTGLEVSGDYRAISGSSGDYDGNAVWGWSDDHVSVLLAGGYDHRSQLPATARDFVTPKFTTQAGALAALSRNPGGGWTGAGMNYISASLPGAANPGFHNPGPGPSFAPPAVPVVPATFNVGAIVQDPACSADWSGLANTNVFNNLTASALGNTAQRCYFRFADFDNLVENTDRWQGYAEINADLGNSMKLHIEGVYGQTNVHNVGASPSYLPTQFPNSSDPSRTIGTVGLNSIPGSRPLNLTDIFIPVTNPGLATLRALNPGSQIAADSASGLYAGALIWRTLTVGGNPAFGNKAQLGQRELDQYRISADLSGDLGFLGDTHWDVAFTQSENGAVTTTPDQVMERLQLAMRGLGSRFGQTPCNIGNSTTLPAGTVPGAGNCFFFNPFSTGIAKQAITGAVNPQFAAAFALDPRVVNDPALVRWLYGPDLRVYNARNQEYVFDALLNGTLPIKLWSQDPVSWAFGGQYRKDTYDATYGAFGDTTVEPCLDTPLTGDMNCANQVGPYGFLGGNPPTHYTGGTKAVFGELDAPITPDLQLQVAARYEKLYGGNDTFNPKASIRWQATDWLALRASGGSTFRAPPSAALTNQRYTILVFTPATGAYFPYDVAGNPALKPEKAKDFNVGAIMNWMGFYGTLDFWQFDFSNPITTESGTAILGAVFPNAPTSFTLGNQCANPAFAAAIAKITFAPGFTCATTTAASNLARVSTLAINGAAQHTRGLDYVLQYVWENPLSDGGDLTFRLDGSWTLDYKVQAQSIGGALLIPAFNAAGELNLNTGVGEEPRTKDSLFVQYGNGGSNLRVTANYLGALGDANNPTLGRQSIFTVPQAGFSTPDTAGAVIASWTTFDASYQYIWDEHNVVFDFTIDNMFDKDPPFARQDYSYNAFTANPLGRTFKIGLTKNL